MRRGMTGPLGCYQSIGFDSNGRIITLWWLPLLNSLLILFSQTSRIELLTSEGICGWPLEALGGGDLLLNIGVAS